MRPVVIPQSRVVEIRDQNLYGSGSNIDNIYEWGNLRSVPMPWGGEQILLSPGRNIDGNVPRDSNYNNIYGEGNNQTLHGYYPARDNIITISGRAGSYQFRL